LFDLLLRACRLPGRDALADLAIDGGRIAAGGGGLGPARETVEVQGRLVAAGLVEAHIHLDKALLGGPGRAAAGTLEEAIRLGGEAKRHFTVDDVRRRARRALEMAVAAGTTALRTHVEVDPLVGLTGMQAVLPLREEYAPAVDLQICAFAQEGIVHAPGTQALLRRALEMGADLVGGCPYNDSDPLEQIRIVFDLAAEFGTDADFHVDFFDEPEHLHVEAIVEQTLRRGRQGRVAVGHLTELAALPPSGQDRIIAGLAEARIGVISLPATDLYLMGRRDTHNLRWGLTPIRRLLEAGVPVALATNNIQNSFTPVGTGDLTHIAYLAASAAHMGTADDLRALLDCITRHPAAILRVPDHGLAPGCRADLVVWVCERVEEIVAALARQALVVKAGRRPHPLSIAHIMASHLAERRTHPGGRGSGLQLLQVGRARARAGGSPPSGKSAPRRRSDAATGTGHATCWASPRRHDHAPSPEFPGPAEPRARVARCPAAHGRTDAGRVAGARGLRTEGCLGAGRQSGRWPTGSGPLMRPPPNAIYNITCGLCGQTWQRTALDRRDTLDCIFCGSRGELALGILPPEQRVGEPVRIEAWLIHLGPSAEGAGGTG
jgi:cytosine deaminase